MITKNLKETIKRIALIKIEQAETFLGSGQGQVKFEYVVNLVIDELKKLPLPVYIRIILSLFQFALKSELRKDIQEIFDEAKLQAG
ncbi:MAG TPA: hypothetical protein DDW90_00660 [Cyanobacteria bacterium UBA9971]|nr:hypothetical protein [Cyanobacteria bacterium UBA9971]